MTVGAIIAFVFVGAVVGAAVKSVEAAEFVHGINCGCCSVCCHGCGFGWHNPCHGYSSAMLLVLVCYAFSLLWFVAWLVGRLVLVRCWPSADLRG